MGKLKALIIHNDKRFESAFGPEELRTIGELVDVYGPRHSTSVNLDNPNILRNAEIIITGWNPPRLDKPFLDLIPRLKAVFHCAASIRKITTEEFWRRNIAITSARWGNARAVAEFTLSQILFSMKCGWHIVNFIKANKRRLEEDPDIHGNFGSTVGILSLGAVGRTLVQLLKEFDLRIIAYDPLVNNVEADSLGVEMCTLDEVFKRADVVTVHTPLLEETRHMVLGRHFRLMKKDTTLINTARGLIIHEEEMIAALRDRPDIQAVLDVTSPEPPIADSPLYTLPNVSLTQHNAGARAMEPRRHGRIIVEELRRFVNGEPLRWSVTEMNAKLLS